LASVALNLFPGLIPVAAPEEGLAVAGDASQAPHA
jgi:hypothetical protein